MDSKNTYFGQEDIKLYLKDVKKHADLIDSDTERDLLFKVHNGDAAAEEQLILANLRYVIFEAKKFVGCGMPLADIISEGNLGLVKAAKRFDPMNNSNKFISYAVYWIRQSIFQSINDTSSVIRIPSNVRAEYNKQRTTTDISNHDLNTYLGIPVVGSLDAPIKNTEANSTLMTIVEDKSYMAPDVYTDENLDSLNFIVNKAMGCLNERETTIIRSYYGIGGDALTLQEIAEDVGLTKERVRQIKGNALRKIRFNSREFIEYLS